MKNPSRSEPTSCSGVAGACLVVMALPPVTLRWKPAPSVLSNPPRPDRIINHPRRVHLALAYRAIKAASRRSACWYMLIAAWLMLDILRHEIGTSQALFKARPLRDPSKVVSLNCFAHVTFTPVAKQRVQAPND